MGNFRCEMEMEPTEAKALNDRGWKHLCHGRRHEALDDFSRAIELDPNLAEAYNNRSIARRIADEDAAEDEDWADALTMHDLEAQMRLRQQRKWMCIGYSARGEPEGEKTAADADFLISFASPDREENNRILHELKTGVCYNGSVRPVTFCTDKSLGMGLHINEGQEMRRWNPIFSDLDQPRQPGEYPPWFKHYKKAAEETRHGLLILQLTDSYLQSKACRWEFGYVRKTELVHVYVPSGDESPGRVVKWDELMEDAELCKQLFGEVLEQNFQGNGDAENPFAMQGTLMRLDKMAKTAEEQEHQAWCELPFRQLAYNFATNTFGEKNAYTIVSAERLVGVYLDTGFAEKALHIGKIGKDLLEPLEKVVGKDPKDHLILKSFLATNLIHLGLAHGNLGDYRKQKDLLERALNILEQHFGEDHPKVALTLTNLGNVHGSLGDYRQSKDFYERALRIREQHLGKDHPKVAVTLACLSNAHGSVGDYSKQKDLLERALRILEQHYGKEHPKVAVTLSNLGDVHGRLGNHSLQKDLLEHALKIQEQHYGKDHPDAAKTLTNLGSMHKSLGDYRQSKDFLERALRIKKQHYGKEHAELAVTLESLGNVHGSLGDYTKQKDLLERALRILEQHFGKEHPAITRTLHNLSNAHGSLGNHEKEKDLLERALKIQEQHCGKDHPKIARTLTVLGIAHGSLGDYRQNKDLLERALRIQEQHFGKEHPEAAVTLYNLGIAHGNLGDYSKQKDFLERALRIQEQHYGKEHHEVGMTVFLLGVTDYSLGDLCRAKESAERALKIFVQHGNPFSEKSEEVQRFLDHLEVKMVQGFTAATDEDRDLLEAIRIALQDDEDLQRALALSLEPSEDVEDPELQEALALSMSPLDAGGAQLVT